MATFTVTTTADVVSASDGVLSLREAVTQANATAVADTIVFAPFVEGQTLTLTGGELTLAQDTTIDGDQNNDGSELTISGGDVDGIITTNGFQTDVVLLDLELRDGHTPVIDAYRGLAEAGGAIYSTGASLTVTNCTLRSNTTYTIVVDQYDANYYWGDGGAIFCDGGIVTISDSKFIGNGAGYGGAIGSSFGSSTTLLIRDSGFYYNGGLGGGAISLNGTLQIENSAINGNRGGDSYFDIGNGGGILLSGSGSIDRCTIIGNETNYGGGGISFGGTQLVISDSTIANNSAYPSYGGSGGGVQVASGNLVIRNSVVTGNVASGDDNGGGGGGIFVGAIASLDIANSIVAGNAAYDATLPRDIAGAITLSNGHNIFGSDVLGNVAGDRENIAANAIFALVDPDTGGGKLNADGIAPLRGNVANPALGGADRFLIGSTDQLGFPRPAPTGTNPDIGSVESSFPVSTVSSANNDTLTGTAAVNTLNGLAGHDFLKGLAGNDTLNGGDGGDFLEGGKGNDRLNGGTGIDIANYGDLDTAVTVDLRGDTASDTDTAKRGTETDTLTGIEGAIGRGGNDRFWGDNGANWFQGGGGKDTFTGGAGRDLYDLNSTSASAVGSGRDVITDFDHLVDKIDLIGIDADTTVAGNQAFRWVGKAALTGPGEVGFFTSGGNTIVRMSTDADVASESEIQLTGIKSLTALDFYL